MAQLEIKEVCRIIKPHFIEKLGKYTHKRVTEKWYYHALGFVKDGMGYLFGINIGFFNEFNENNYSDVGMNLTIRQNGKNPELRQKIHDFWAAELYDWINREPEKYESERGGIGIKFSRYQPIEDLKNIDEIVLFLKDSIDEFHVAYSKIAEEKSGLFNGVLRAAPPWDQPIIDLLNNQTKSNRL